jgi:hypothetical protein
VTVWMSWPIPAAWPVTQWRSGRGGWTEAGSPLLSRAAGPREALADPAYRAAVMNLAFNALPYLAPLRETVRPRGELASRPPGPSQSFTVDSSWQRWQPPSGPVH